MASTKVGQRLALGQTNWIQYNSKGQVWKQLDFKGQTVEYRYDQFGRVTNKFYFTAGDTAHPSNSVAYAFNPLGQLTNITERAGTQAGMGYAMLFGDPDSLWADNGHHPVRARLRATLAKVPADVQGGVIGLFGLLLAFLAVPCKKRRPLVCCLRVLLKQQWELLHLGSVETTRRRLRLPSLFWRAVTLVAMAALIVSDPAYQRLWTAQAQCTIPSNPTVSDDLRQTYFSYNLEGRLSQQNSPEGVVNYTYDLATGRLTRTCSAKSEVQYTYDDLGRLKTVAVVKRNGATVSPAEITTYTYTKVGNRDTVSLPNGVVTTWRYDNLNRLTNVTHVAGTTNLASYTYTLHPTGRRTNAMEILRQEDNTYLTNTLTWQFDAMYRLTNEISLCSSSANSYTNAYQYDKAGNRFKKTRVANSGTTVVTNAYDANDQLLKEVTLVGGAPTQTNNYAYDANGSLVGKTNIAGTTTTVLYGYDLRNRLSSVTANGSTTSYLYNDAGIRVRSWTAGGNPRTYLIDANNATGYAQVLEEFDVIGGTPNLAMSYVIGDDVLAQGVSSASYLLYDGHGSTRQLVSGALGVTSKYNFDAYGVTQANSYNAGATSLQYCGEQYDSTLNMYNLRARYYNPGTGTFNQRDTFAGNNFDPQSLHKYAYVHSDPVNGIDPTGEFTLVEMLVVAGIVGILAALIIPTILYQIQKHRFPPRLLGIFVHSVIFLWYNVVYPYALTDAAIAPGINNDRTDIRFPGSWRVPLALRGEIYEIKPEGSLQEPRDVGRPRGKTLRTNGR